MGINTYDLREAYEQVKSHLDHKLVVANYSNGDNVAIECETCGEVLLSYGRPAARSHCKSVPAIFELDDNSEATGSVLHFCSNECAGQRQQSQNFPFPRCKDGQSNGYVDGEVCDMCGQPLDHIPPVIRGRCHDDGHNIIALFDATPWFEQATDHEILALSASEATFLPEEWADLPGGCWGQDYPADVVAVFMADHNDRVAAMFALIEHQRGVGFECYVHPIDAAQWIQSKRPHLLEKITPSDMPSLSDA